jgi:hemolysin activation/secretion protein
MSQHTQIGHNHHNFRDLQAGTRRAATACMWRSIVVALVLASAVLGWNRDEDVNVNSRYTVESVRVEGYRSSDISPALRSELEALVGQRFDPSLFDRVSARICRDLRVNKVSMKVSRGEQLEHVRVEFLVENQPGQRFDIAIPEMLYQSRQGVSGALEVRTDLAGHRLAFGVLSDNNSEIERFSGIEARYSHDLGSKRVRFGFNFDSYHQQWNSSTVNAYTLNPTTVPAGLYRSRENYQPTLTFVLAEPLTLHVGAAFQSIEEQAPVMQREFDNAAAVTLAYHREWWTGNVARSSMNGEYVLRAATHLLDSDFVFVRNSVDLRYQLAAGKQTVLVTFLAGAINGEAPLFERFVLGNATTLRGWNKFDIAPLGGNRVVHGSVEYRWRWFEAFYDTGAVWNQGTHPDQKQGAGFGVRTTNKDALLLAVAFPLRSGRVDPIFIVGFNF